MNETLRGIQAEQAAYENTRDLLAALDESVDEATVAWWLDPMAECTPEKAARVVARFEEPLLVGQRPQRVNSSLGANDATILEIRRRMRAAANMPAPEPLTPPTPTPTPHLRCRRCGQTGYGGQYPFSTLPDGDVCDDCA